MPKIRNIIIFVAIAAIFVLVYVFFIRSSSTSSLVSSATSLPSVGTDGTSATASNGATGLVTKDFLSLLLNVKNIKLDDSIFSDQAFQGLNDPKMVLEQDGTEGRPNPFAQFGAENIATVPAAVSTTDSTTATPATTTKKSTTKTTTQH